MKVNDNVYPPGFIKAPRHSKTIQDWVDKHRTVVADYYTDAEGHWVSLREGWISPDVNCRTIQEDTVQEVMKKLKGVVWQGDK